MSVAILGGLDRLKGIYEKRGRDMGFDIRVFSQRVPNLGRRLTRVSGIVIFTGTVAHHMVVEANSIARKYDIPVWHSPTSSVSGLKKCLYKFTQALEA